MHFDWHFVECVCLANCSWCIMCNFAILKAPTNEFPLETASLRMFHILDDQTKTVQVLVFVTFSSVTVWSFDVQLVRRANATSLCSSLDPHIEICACFWIIIAPARLNVFRTWTLIHPLHVVVLISETCLVFADPIKMKAIRFAFANRHVFLIYMHKGEKVRSFFPRKTWQSFVYIFC